MTVGGDRPPEAGSAPRPGPGGAAGEAARPENFAARHPLLSVVGLLALLVAVGLLLVWLASPDGSEYADAWPERTAFMELRIEQAREEGRELDLRYRPVPLSTIPRSVQRAVLAAEDAAFWSHGGFDWEQIRHALRKAWQERSISRGASTITQQLAKNLYLSPSRNPLRKLREAVIAWKMERALSKARILELYLNVVEFGPGIFGVEAATRRYFGTGVSEVGPDRAAMLAATLPSPLRNNPATDTGRFRWRTNLIRRLAFGSDRERIEVTPPPRGAIEVRDPFASPPLADTLRADTAPGTPLFPAVPAPAPDTAAGERDDVEPRRGVPDADSLGPETPEAVRVSSPTADPGRPARGRRPGRTAPISPAARASSPG